MLIWIPGRLPGLNEMLQAKSTQTGKWNRYNEFKCQWSSQIKVLIQAKGIGLSPPGYGSFLFIEPSMKRDPDNLVSGGVKLLLDCFVGAGVLAGDGWADNLGFVGYWICRKNRAGCLVHWGEEILTKDAMLALFELGAGSWDCKRPI